MCVLCVCFCTCSTNLPVETMGFPDFEFPNRGRSFVSSDEVLQFFTSYARHFNVVERVQFEHHVVLVKPIENERWEVLVKDLTTNSYKTDQFDYAMICNGHNSVANMPDIAGSDIFLGKQLHSHSYRTPDSYKGLVECLLSDT